MVSICVSPLLARAHRPSSRMANRKILELEATLKDTTSLAENTTEVTDLKKSLNRAMTRHEEESTRTKNQLEELQKHLDHAGECRRHRDDSPSSFSIA